MGVARFTTLVAALASAAAPATAAEEPLHMAPASKWVADFAEDSCALRRVFRAGDDEVTLQFKQFSPAPSAEVTVISGTLGRRRGKVAYSFLPNEEVRLKYADFVGSDSLFGVAFYYGFSSAPTDDGDTFGPLLKPEERDARERSVTELRLDGVFSRSVILEMGPMHAPMDAMRLCTRDLVTTWGLDPEVQRTLSRGAVPIDIASWVRRVQASYPDDMARKSLGSGKIYVRLIVETDGNPKSCVALSDISNPAFTDEACAQLMHYAKFEPALDAEGRPVDSYFTTSITYRIQ